MKKMGPQTSGNIQTLRVFQVETKWKRSFPRRLNVKFMWCVCKETSEGIDTEHWPAMS